jgi:hypothetical protein
MVPQRPCLSGKLSGVESKPASKDRIKTSQSEAWYSYWFAGVHTSGFIAN